MENANHFQHFLAVALCLIVNISATAQDSSQAAMLETAYQSKSLEKLESFFDQWSNEIQPNEKEAHGLVRETHAIFAAFYQPDVLNELGYKTYKNYPYQMVQGSLWRIMVSGKKSVQKDDAEFDDFNHTGCTLVDSAIEFRPNVHIEGKRVVYLTKGYKALLEDFRHTFVITRVENIPPDSNDTWIIEDDFAPDADMVNSEKRMDFLRNKMEIRTSGFYSELGPIIPCMDEVVFDRSKRSALVTYTIAKDLGGTALFRKKGGKWHFVKNVSVWLSDSIDCH